ncbi:MAG: DUF1573 domain-containing protein [Prevotella sp.]|nr:DUF1573 domain-containing protein [Prevotella sp.]
MKKILTIAMLLFACVNLATAQEQQAQIKFDKLTHNFGKFSETDPVQTCTFAFTNTGTAPLVINQALASCGCTVPEYTKKPVAPGEKGEIKITYNGKGKFPGHFKKTVTVRTNGVPEMTRLYVEGDMEEAKQ